jgi:energy-coupling factor transporter ATP-binding protein EcfA2
MIHIKDLRFKYNQQSRDVLDALSLDVEEGEWIVITGDSGCGKSTLALGLAGFLTQIIPGIISGEIMINKKDILKENSALISEDVFLVQQNPETQFCTLTVREELAFGLENKKTPPEIIQNRITRALTALDADDLINKQINELSGGQQQKVAIATALTLEPKVLILDEPSSNLDPTAIKSLFKTLSELRSQKRLTVIIIEHKPWVLEGLEYRHFVMRDGKLFEEEKKDKEWGWNFEINPQCEVSHSFPVLELNDFTINFFEKNILHINELRVDEGEIISLMGPNGSGKTSFLLALCGLLEFKEKQQYLFN